jgi:CRISPR-associated exonuclease Cas4
VSSGAPVSIAQGYLYYARTGRRKAVPLDDALRDQTIQTIAAVRDLIQTRRRPEVEYSPRCKGCSVHDICLPREVARLRRQG